MPIFIDSPSLVTPAFEIAGWVAGPTPNPVDVFANGQSLGVQLRDRPDVRAAIRNYPFITGFVARTSLNAIPRRAAVLIEVRYADERKAAEVGVNDELLANIPRQNALRERHAKWCREHLVCSQCRASLKDYSFVETGCPSCGTTYRQGTRAINMISDALLKSSNIFETGNVSSNPYEPLALELIETTTKKGGWVLDCGAGSRPERTPNVINVEIANYFSTDVLAVGEALPFHDDSFDGAVSLAVLEHVRDPFGCAKELLRVVKPGSNIMCSVSFLQPVHGYPSHYYNMTQEGLKNLFEPDARIVKCFVPLHGHPIFGLQRFLGEYLRGLPEEVRTEFSKMTLGDTAKLVSHEFLTNPAAYRLTTDAMNTVACLNTVVLEKTSAGRIGAP